MRQRAVHACVLDGYAGLQPLSTPGLRVLVMSPRNNEVTDVSSAFASHRARGFLVSYFGVCIWFILELICNYR